DRSLLFYRCQAERAHYDEVGLISRFRFLSLSPPVVIASLLPTQFAPADIGQVGRIHSSLISQLLQLVLAAVFLAVPARVAPDSRRSRSQRYLRLWLLTPPLTNR